MRYEFGHIDPWWDEQHTTLAYQYTPLTNDDDEARWIQEGYGYFRNLNGMTCVFKQDPPDWASPFLSMFDWQHQGMVAFKMMPGDALPSHQDQYNTYRRIFNITDPFMVHRCIVFMEDWKSGHYFEIDDHCVSNWRKGDWVWWNYDVPHAVANIGLEPRYTMQITGLSKK